MGVISEFVEGFFNSFFNNINNKKKKRDSSCWEKLSPLSVPSWVERKSHKFHNKYPVKHHDKRKDFFGKIYIYRVIYQKSSHGRVEETFYRKKK